MCWIGGHLSGFVQSARDVGQMAVIEGCDIGCAKSILKHAEVPLQAYLVITDLGIEKNKDFHLKRSDIERVKKAVRESIGKATSALPERDNLSQRCSCCG